MNFSFSRTDSLLLFLGLLLFAVVGTTTTIVGSSISTTSQAWADVIEGTEGPDTIVGTSGDDIIDSKGGNPTNNVSGIVTEPNVLVPVAGGTFYCLYQHQIEKELRLLLQSHLQEMLYHLYYSK
jgi:hypothetical protein